MCKVSVIIPNYNHSLFLEERIESILNQTFRNIEVFILDDCSTDSSREIIEKYRKHPLVKEIIYNKTNSGSTFKQWKKGIEKTKGDWIWIAESDDVALPDFLEVLTSKIDNDTGLIYCRSNLINEGGESVRLYGFSSMPDPEVYKDFGMNFTTEGYDFVKRFMLDMNAIPNASAVIFKRELVQDSVFESTGKTRLFGDWLFWLHLLRRTKISFINMALNDFRFHSNTVRKDTHFTSVRLREYMVLVKYFEKEFGYGKEALDCLLYHYLSGEIPYSCITFMDHCKIIFFILKRNPLLLMKSYYRKLKRN